MKKQPMLMLFVTLWILAPTGYLWAQPVVFSKVKVRYNRSEKDLRLVDKDVVLVFDDSARKLTVKSDDKPLEVKYDELQKAVFEITSHMRGGAFSQLVGGLAGAAIASKQVADYWCYFEYKKPDGSLQPYLLEIDKESSDQVIEKMKSILGDKVRIAEFPEKEEKIEKDTLKDLQSKHSQKMDKKQRLMPEIKPDKALVVVVCPPLAARYSGTGNQYKLHANDRVVAVNKMGTYSFAYLDPGEYLLVSQIENASGIRLKLEAGQDYYFLQNTFMGAWKPRTSLTRHTKELVSFELSGASYSDWKRK